MKKKNHISDNIDYEILSKTLRNCNKTEFFVMKEYA